MSKKQDDDKVDEVQELEEKEQVEQAEEFENRWKRALADYQNLEKRVREEKVAWIKASNKDLILRLLPILDTLILASKHAKDETLKITLSQFLDILKGEGVEKIETVGKEFDPHTMECVETVAGQEENKVVEEIKPGYTQYEQIIRPAFVKVGKGESKEN